MFKLRINNMVDKRIVRKKLIQLLIICFISIPLPFCCAGCGHASSTDADTKATDTTEKLQEDDLVGKSTSIKLTDNYYYSLPEGLGEAKEDFDDSVEETHFFSTPDKSRQIRSWVYSGEYVFPNDVEAMKDGEDVEIVYGGLYDTAIARVTDRIEEDGQTIYRTLYVWPDGPNCTCFIDIASFDVDYSDFENEIRGSIRNSNPAEGTGPYGFYNENAGTPSPEEINEAMGKEVEEAFEDYMFEQEYDDYHVFPYF